MLWHAQNRRAIIPSSRVRRSSTRTCTGEAANSRGARRRMTDEKFAPGSPTEGANRAACGGWLDKVTVKLGGGAGRLKKPTRTRLCSSVGRAPVYWTGGHWFDPSQRPHTFTANVYHCRRWLVNGIGKGRQRIVAGAVPAHRPGDRSRLTGDCRVLDPQRLVVRGKLMRQI